MVKNAGKIEDGSDDMEKIDYGLRKIIDCWNDVDKIKSLDCLLPMDFNLDDIEECRYTDVHFTPCEKCWNKEIEVMI